MPRKGNQKHVAAGKKGRDLQLERLKMEAVVVAISDEDVEMADEEQPAAAEAVAEKAVAEEQPACGLLALPWDWWEVAVVLQRRPLRQARFLGLVGMTCKLLHTELDTVYEPNSLGRVMNTMVRPCSHRAPTSAHPARPTRRALVLQMELQRAVTSWKDLLLWLKASKARYKAEVAAKKAKEEEELAQREGLRARWEPVLAEVTGREAEMARLFGAKKEPPYLKSLNDQQFKDFNASGHPDATVGLALVFPALHAALMACEHVVEWMECRCYVISMLVRAGVMAPRVLNRCNPNSLRV